MKKDIMGVEGLRSYIDRNVYVCIQSIQSFKKHIYIFYTCVKIFKVFNVFKLLKKKKYIDIYSNSGDNFNIIIYKINKKEYNKNLYKVFLTLNTLNIYTSLKKITIQNFKNLEYSKYVYFLSHPFLINIMLKENKLKEILKKEGILEVSADSIPVFNDFVEKSILPPIIRDLKSIVEFKSVKKQKRKWIDSTPIHLRERISASSLSVSILSEYVTSKKGRGDCIRAVALSNLYIQI